VETLSWTVLVVVIAGVGIAGLLSGCAHLIPTGKVVDEERFLGPAEAPVEASREPRVPFPVLPFSVWGLHFDEELVLELVDHPTWRMLEVVRVEVGGEEVWFSLDSHRCGRQWVAVDDRSEPIAAGFPAPSYRSDLKAQRFRDAGWTRYTAGWTMRAGERIEIEARARRPLWRTTLRNGNTMNHSQETALALIDLERLRPALATVTIDGVEQKTSVLSRGLLVQAAAGLMEQRRVIGAAGEGAVAREEQGDEVVYERTDVPGGFDLVARRPTSTETWRFVEHGGGQHAQQVRIEQEGREVFRLRFNPPLADVRSIPDTERISRVVASVNGRPGYMSGEVHIGPGGDAGDVVIRVLPRAPRWARARPARSVVSFGDDSTVSVDTAVEPANPWSFGDVECPG